MIHMLSPDSPVGAFAAGCLTTHFFSESIHQGLPPHTDDLFLPHSSQDTSCKL